MKIDTKKICYIFDVDGTLTEPRKIISEDFKENFINWMENKEVFISTGSDFAKIEKQLTKEVLEKTKLIFCCMGNEMRDSSGRLIKKSVFNSPEGLENDLNSFVLESNFPEKTGNHLEYRTGMLNFSVVGRNANDEQREEYYSWDKTKKEREKIASFINEKYPLLEASVGGSISIDIIRKGQDKGQTIEFLKACGVKEIIFVGDKCHKGGNDYGIIRELLKSSLTFEWYNVSGFLETRELINSNASFLG